MSIDRKVMWLEGAFLRPQHFQQQDRYFSSALTNRARMSQPYYWGFSELEIDEGQLAYGIVALRRCVGAFHDGEVFAWPPGDAYAESMEPAAPLAVQVDKDAVGQIVYLVIQPAAAGVAVASRRRADGKSGGTRYVIEDVAVKDALMPGQGDDPIEVGRCDMRLVVGEVPSENTMMRLPIAQIAGIEAPSTVRLDRDFVPTVTRLAAAPNLSTSVSEVANKLLERSRKLASGATGSNAFGRAAILELMQLRLLNGGATVFREYGEAKVHHPELLYRELLGLAGELSLFRKSGDLSVKEFPTYDHDDISRCFTPVLREIRLLLEGTLEQDAFPIKLAWDEHDGHRGYFGEIQQPFLLKNGRFFLIARPSQRDPQFRDNFRRQTIITSQGRLHEFLDATSGGVEFEPVDRPPYELPQRTGWTYYEIQQTGELWEDIVGEAAIAIHLTDFHADADIELWGLRGDL